MINLQMEVISVMRECESESTTAPSPPKEGKGSSTPPAVPSSAAPIYNITYFIIFLVFFCTINNLHI